MTSCSSKILLREPLREFISDSMSLMLSSPFVSILDKSTSLNPVLYDISGKEIELKQQMPSDCGIKAGSLGE
jgi:hypothetical protein